MILWKFVIALLLLALVLGVEARVPQTGDRVIVHLINPIIDEDFSVFAYQGNVTYINDGFVGLNFTGLLESWKNNSPNWDIVMNATRAHSNISIANNQIAQIDWLN